MGQVTYKLKLPKQWRIHLVFHAALLSPFKITEQHGQVAKPLPPDLVDREEEWEIEAIVVHKKMQHGIKYLVKWKGFSFSENTWEPASNLWNAQDLLTAYRKVHRLDKSPST